MVRDLGHVEVHAGATPLGGARIAPAPSSALFGFPTSSPGTPRVCAWKHVWGALAPEPVATPRRSYGRIVLANSQLSIARGYVLCHGV